MNDFFSFAKDLQEAVTKSRRYSIVTREGRIFVNFDPHSALTARENLDILADYMIETLRLIRVRELSAVHLERYRSVVALSVLMLEKVGGFSKIDVLQAKVLAVALGGCIPYPSLLKEKYKVYVEFVIANHLYEALPSLGIQLASGLNNCPTVPVAHKKSGMWSVAWDDMQIIWKDGEYHYYLDDILLFKTDKKRVLTAEYPIYFLGIAHYNRGVEKLLPVDFQKPDNWGRKNLIEVWTSFRRGKNRDYNCMWEGIHAWIVLRKSTGEVYSLGQDVLHDITQDKWKYTFSTKKGSGKIVALDPYYFYPRETHSSEKATIEITDEEWDQVINAIEEDRQNPDWVVSAMRNNCVSYIIKLLHRTLGYKISGEISNLSILWLNAFHPDSYEKIRSFSDRLEKKKLTWVQKALYFFPPFYLVAVLVGIMCKMMGQNNYKNMTDLRWSDVFLRPWVNRTDHPWEFRRSLKKMVDEDGFIPRSALDSAQCHASPTPLPQLRRHQKDLGALERE